MRRCHINCCCARRATTFVSLNIDDLWDTIHESAKPQIIMVHRVCARVRLPRRSKATGKIVAAFDLAPKEESFTERQCVPGNSNINYIEAKNCITCLLQPKDELARERKINSMPVITVKLRASCSN